MSIEKLALDYITNDKPIVSTAKTVKTRKTRKALQSAYERYRAKYVENKKIVDDIKAEGAKLQAQYAKYRGKMDAFQKKMSDIREYLNQIDNSGENFIEIEEETEDPEEDTENNPQ